MIPDDADLSPTARALFYALVHHGPSTPTALSDASNTPPSSTKQALRELREANLVARESGVKDRRQSVYRIRVESHTDAKEHGGTTPTHE